MYRVIWQYDMVRMGDRDAAIVPAEPLHRGAADALFSGLPLASPPEPVFQEAPISLRAREIMLPNAYREERANDLAAYQQAFLEDSGNADTLRDRLAHEPGVLYAEVQPRPVPAFIIDETRRRRATIARTEVTELELHPNPTVDYEARQRYLDAAPDGIDARFAWQIPGGSGAGGRMADIESGWNFDHEDLLDNQVGLIHGVNSSYKDHGTAVLGIVGGDRNRIGVVGISPDASCSAYSAEYDWSSPKWNAAEAIRKAANRLRAGDVILLEMHAPGPNASGSGQDGFIAIEYWQAEYAAIRYATSLGVHVVEAAGNGGENLDDAAYGSRFDRGTRDSGAILVGGGGSAFQPDPRERIWWSNHGSRLDLQGWGEDIVTTGGRESATYHDLRDDPNPARCYTKSFGGTSGASPIVVGAVLAVAGIMRAAGRPPLTCAEMRALLVETGTPQAGATAASESIGPLPNLRAALGRLGFG